MAEGCVTSVYAENHRFNRVKRIDIESWPFLINWLIRYKESGLTGQRKKTVFVRLFHAVIFYHWIVDSTSGCHRRCWYPHYNCSVHTMFDRRSISPNKSIISNMQKKWTLEMISIINRSFQPNNSMAHIGMIIFLHSFNFQMNFSVFIDDKKKWLWMRLTHNSRRHTISVCIHTETKTKMNSCHRVAPVSVHNSIFLHTKMAELLLQMRYISLAIKEIKCNAL